MSDEMAVRLASGAEACEQRRRIALDRCRRRSVWTGPDMRDPGHCDRRSWSCVAHVSPPAPLFVALSAMDERRVRAAGFPHGFLTVPCACQP